MGRPAVATSRFATAGCFTAEQLEKGADLEAIQESQASDGPDFDPDDKRSLYERLMEQKDAKQAEWEQGTRSRTRWTTGAGRRRGLKTTV